MYLVLQQMILGHSDMKWDSKCYATEKNDSKTPIILLALGRGGGWAMVQSVQHAIPGEEVLDSIPAI